jgi:sulfotransferase family protein
METAALVQNRPALPPNGSAAPCLVLIGSSSHSGSTLLDLMLGAHSSVSSAGEMNRLTLFSDDRVCTCGATVTRCAYWNRVLAEVATSLGRTQLRWSECETDITPIEPLVGLEDGPDMEFVEGGGVPLRLRAALARNGIRTSATATLKHGGIRDAKWRLMDAASNQVLVLRRQNGGVLVYPPAPNWKNPLRRLPSALELAVALGADRAVPFLARVSGEAAALLQTARNSWRVADAMAAVDGTHLVVDSSKTAVRLKLLHLVRPENTRVLYLVRDGRAVAASAMRRSGITAAAAARIWKRENQTLALVLRGIGNAQKHRVRYEDLCENPAREMSRICDFLGIPFEPAMVRLWERPVHNIPGNPMLFQKSRREIARDERWRRELSAADIATIEHLAGSMNREFGYA